MINGKRVVAVTLARGGSKGIPKKNIVDIAGQPLLMYTVNAIRESKFIDSYFVSTDDDEIYQLCVSNGVSCIRRPLHLSSDTAKSSDALIHAIENLECDYVVEVMATNPLKETCDIDGCIELIFEKTAESVVSVVRVYDHHPSRIKFLNEDGVMKNFYPEDVESRRQDLSPPAYIRNGSIYVMTKLFLMENKARYGKDSIAYIMPLERTINIDEPEDLEIARLRLERR